MGRKKWVIAMGILLAGVTGSGCSAFDFGLFGGGSSSDNNSPDADREVEGQFALALGGVAPDWDLLEPDIDLEDRTLDFSTEDDNLLDFSVPDGFGSFSEAGGTQLVPLEIGTAVGLVEIDGSFADQFRTITAPQKLIQILVGEACHELATEATTDDSGAVLRTSSSPTGDALASVIKNRIDLIEQNDSPSLFAADPDLFDSDPPTSQYEAVIEAESNGVYQFSPLDPDDVRNEVYFQAAARADIEEDANLVAYDQAVSAAAFVFSDDTEDPTDGAFGFYSPTAIQYQKVEEALLSETTTLPTGIGTSDAQFPFFAPIQIVILPYVAGRADDETIPAFVFIRERESDEPAVVNE